AGDEVAAASARREVTAARELEQELTVAVPFAERAVEQARTAREEAERAKARAEAARLGDLLVKAGQRLDTALAEAGEAFHALLQLRPSLGHVLREVGQSAKADLIGKRWT